MNSKAAVAVFFCTSHIFWPKLTPEICHQTKYMWFTMRCTVLIFKFRGQDLWQIWGCGRMLDFALPLCHCLGFPFSHKNYKTKPLQTLSIAEEGVETYLCFYYSITRMMYIEVEYTISIQCFTSGIQKLDFFLHRNWLPYFVAFMQVREARTEISRYGGEASGIRAGIKRSIKMKA